MENTSVRLKRIMAERRLRQVDIIKLAQPYCREYNLKLTKSDMSQFVSGKVEPGSWKLAILARALNVSEAWLMGYDVPMEPYDAPETGKAQFSAVDGSGESSLQDNEKHLLEMFRQLNAEGQEKVIEYTGDLVASGRYIKINQPSMADEA